MLYTDYEPLPNPFYLTYDKAYAEPTGSSPIYDALLSCASSTNTFFEASSSTQIASAMQTMLHLALTSPARLAD